MALPYLGGRQHLPFVDSRGICPPALPRLTIAGGAYPLIQHPCSSMGKSDCDFCQDSSSRVRMTVEGGGVVGRLPRGTSQL
jgi:hypothetical protein